MHDTASSIHWVIVFLLLAIIVPIVIREINEPGDTDAAEKVPAHLEDMPDSYGSSDSAAQSPSEILLFPLDDGSLMVVKPNEITIIEAPAP